MKRFIRTLLCAAAAAAVCSAAWAAGSVELKLLVKPELFAAGRAAGYGQLWQAIRTEAEKLGMAAEADGDFGEESSEIVRYFDTAAGDLGAKDYTVRQKFKVKKGTPQAEGELMLKLRRGAEIAKAERDQFCQGLGHEMKVKYEEDLVGLVDGVPGKTRSALSISAKRKNLQPALGKTVEWLSEYFPTLKGQGLPMDAPLGLTAAEVLEVGAELGEVKVLGKEEAEMETAVWYDAQTQRLLLVELSWKYKPAKAAEAEKHRALFAALQNRTDVFAAGKTKTGK